MNDNLRELFYTGNRYARYYKIIYKNYNYVKGDLLSLLSKVYSYNISRVYKRQYKGDHYERIMIKFRNGMTLEFCSMNFARKRIDRGRRYDCVLLTEDISAEEYALLEQVHFDYRPIPRSKDKPCPYAYRGLDELTSRSYIPAFSAVVNISNLI
jgi:hypothetical protein